MTQNSNDNDATNQNNGRKEEENPTRITSPIDLKNWPFQPVTNTEAAIRELLQPLIGKEAADTLFEDCSLVDDSYAERLLVLSVAATIRDFSAKRGYTNTELRSAVDYLYQNRYWYPGGEDQLTEPLLSSETICPPLGEWMEVVACYMACYLSTFPDEEERPIRR
jgi:hypothetical protein